MNILNSAQGKAVLVFLVVSGILSPGCARFHKSFPDIKTYSLDAGPGKHAAFSGPPISVRLNTMEVAPQFADRYLTYRTDEMSYESDFYNQLMASPAVIIRDQAREWLQASPVIEYILPAGSSVESYYLIDGRVLEFYGDYRRPDEPKAVLKIEWTLSKSATEGREVVFQKVYPETFSISGTSPRLLLQGWDQTLIKILSAFEGDLRMLAEHLQSK